MTTTEWEETKTINPYTRKHNKKRLYKGCQCLVFRRANGWAYTVRLKYDDERWIQISSISNKYYESESVAQMASMATAVDFLAEFNLTEAIYEDVLCGEE